jgi:hypothetical protein
MSTTRNESGLDLPFTVCRLPFAVYTPMSHSLTTMATKREQMQQQAICKLVKPLHLETWSQDDWSIHVVTSLMEQLQKSEARCSSLEQA